MSHAIEAIYDGTAFLTEGPVDLKPNTRVLIVPAPKATGKKKPALKSKGSRNGPIDLRAIGISRRQAADLRARLACFTDWDDPAMDVYDHYDEYMAKLKTR